MREAEVKHFLTHLATADKVLHSLFERTRGLQCPPANGEK